MLCNDSDARSPFERPKISMGYPLDDDERQAIEEGLAALREEPPADPLPGTQKGEGC